MKKLITAMSLAVLLAVPAVAQDNTPTQMKTLPRP